MMALIIRNFRLTHLLLLALTFLLTPALFADNDKDWREWQRDRREAYGVQRRHGDRGYDRYGRDDRRWESYGDFTRRRGLSQGYRDGYEKGEQDFRKHRAPSLSRHDRFRDADHGYKHEYGDKNFYRQGYREGFENGYHEGFGRYAWRRY